MPDGSDTSLTHTHSYRRGDQLVYLVCASGSRSAPDVAQEVADLVDVHDLGDWSISPIGIGWSLAYFDLELRQDTDRVYLKLITGLDPDVY